MLIRMAVWSSREIAQRIRRAIKTFFPSIDILSIDMILNDSLGYAILFSDSIFYFCKIEYNARKYKVKTFALPRCNLKKQAEGRR